MILQSDGFDDSNYQGQHLELNFGKSCLVSTCESKTFLTEQSTQPSSKQSVHKEFMRNTQVITIQYQKQKPLEKESALNRKSRCFMKEIGKVLKKSKIKTSTQSNQNLKQKLNKQYFTFSSNSSSIPFKANISRKKTTDKSETKKIIQEDKIIKEKFNLEEFLESQLQKKQAQSKRKLKVKKQFLKFKSQQRNKTVFVCDLSESQNFDSSSVKKERFSQRKRTCILQNRQNFATRCSQNQDPTLSNIFFDSQKNQNIFSIETSKSSRVLSVKQSQRQEIQKKNKLENSKLQKSLKKAMTNFSLNCQNQSIDRNKDMKIQAGLKTEQKLEESQGYSQTIQKIHYDKMKKKVMNKMNHYQKVNQMKEDEEKQKKTFQKKRTVSAQPKLILTVEGTTMMLKKQEKQHDDVSNNRFENHRNFTTITRTGLEYDKRSKSGVLSIDKKRKITHLTGVKSSANHYRTFSKNTTRQIEELDECKSDRVVRQLRKKYTTRPNTARQNKSLKRLSTARRENNDKDSELACEKMIKNLSYVKVTKKEIEKENMKEKLLRLLVECQEEKIYHGNLKKGLDIFQDYCDNIDQGLKKITQQIENCIAIDV